MTDPLAIIVDLSDIPKVAVNTVYQEFRVALPAGALAYRRDTSRVTASPRVSFQLFNRKLHVDPDVPGVPVLHYAGGGYGFWLDLDDGDPTLLLACDGPVSGYYDTGTTTVPGAGSGSHTWGCAVAYPGGRVSNPNSPTPPPNAAGEGLVGAADGSACVRFRGAGKTAPAELGTVVVASAGPEASLLLGGPNAADPVACANEVQANLVALNTAIQAIPATGGPWDAVLVAIKGAMAAWAGALQPMGDLKARVEGPVLLP